MAELYIQSNRLVLQDAFGSTPMRGLTDVALSSSSFSLHEIFRNGDNIRFPYALISSSTLLANQLDGFFLRVTSEPTGSIWHNRNNGISRLYMSNGSQVLGFIPGEVLTSVVNRSLSDPNLYGSTQSNTNFFPGSGTNTTSDRYLGYPTRRVFPIGGYVQFNSVVDAAGTNEWGASFQLLNTSGNVTYTQTIRNYGIGAPSQGQIFNFTLPLTSNVSGINLNGGDSTNRARVQFTINNFSVIADFALHFISVPATVTINRVII